MTILRVFTDPTKKSQYSSKLSNFNLSSNINSKTVLKLKMANLTSTFQSWTAKSLKDIESSKK